MVFYPGDTVRIVAVKANDYDEFKVISQYLDKTAKIVAVYDEGAIISIGNAIVSYVWDYDCFELLEREYISRRFKVKTEPKEEPVKEHKKVERIGKDEYYLGIAKAVSMRSTCLRRRYGAVIVRDDEIISTGYNGAPRGEQNCSDTGVCYRMENNVPHGERYEKCLSGETVVKMLNGEYKTLKELADLGLEDFWVYSINTDTGEIVPAKAMFSRITGFADNLLKVTFDNGKSVMCTRDHLFLMRDCTYKSAESLSYGDSVMPMYYNFSRNVYNGVGYESVCNTISMRKGRLSETDKCNTPCTPTHHLVYAYSNSEELDLGENDELIHHINENRRDNSPGNLEKIGRSEHTKNHLSEERIAAFAASAPKGRASFIKRLREDPNFFNKVSERGKRNMLANWENPDFREKLREVQSRNGKTSANMLNSSAEIRERMLKSRVLKGLNLLKFKMISKNDTTQITSENYEKLQKKYRSEGRGKDQIPKYKTILKHFNTLEEALEQAAHYNHKVVSVEEVEYKGNVYDLYVPEFNNYAVDLGDNSCVFVHNCCAVHAEMNAIISAKRSEMIGATLYLYGYDVVEDKEIAAVPCDICARLIKNTGIEGVVSKEERNAN